MRNAIRFFWLSILALGMVLPATAQTTSRVSFEQGQGDGVVSSVQLCPPNNIVLTQGQSGTYRLTTSNPNPVPIIGYFFDVAVTSELSLSNYATTLGTWTVQQSRMGGLEVPTLGPGQQFELSFRITGETPGIATMTLNSGDEQNPGEPEDCTVFVDPAAPEIAVQKRDQLLDGNGDGEANPGETLAYIIDIINVGDGDAEAVVFTDLAGDHLNTTLVAGSVGTSQGQITSGNGAGDTDVTVDIGPIGPNETVTVSFEVLIADPFPPNLSEVANQGQINGENFGTVLTDDPATAPQNDPTRTPIVPASQQLVIEAVTPSDIPTLDVGEAVDYTITVVDPDGVPVAGAVVDVDDGLLGTTRMTPETDDNGQTTYNAAVPDGTADGRYTLSFVARAGDFDDSDPVERQVDVVNREPGLAVAPNPVVFEQTPLGTFADGSVTIRNTGQDQLTVSGIQITGGDAGDFTLPALTLPLVVAPGASTDVTVRFTPGLRGQRSAALQVNSNGGDATVTISGEGTAPGIAVEPSLVGFGMVQVGSSASRNLLTITNTGNAPLTINDVVLAGADVAAFAVTGGGGQRVLEPGGTHTVGLRFSPPRAGVHRATLDIASDALDEAGNPVGTVQVALVGEGQAPGIAVEPPQVGFGMVQVGSSASRNLLTITNTGNAPLTINDVVLAGADVAAFAVTGGGGQRVLEPGGTHTVGLRFSPPRAGVHRATLDIASDALDEAGNPVGTVQVALVGEGIGGTIDPPNVGSAEEGTPVGIRVAIPDGFIPVTRQLFFRMGGQTAFQQVDMQDDQGGLLGEIPAAFVTERGLLYYVRLANAAGAVTYPADDPENNPEWLPVAVDILEAGGDFEPMVYRMVSAPLVLQNPSVQNLVDDYGPPDPTQWRVLRWRPGTQEYEELPRPGGGGPGFGPGDSAWLITRAGQGFDVMDGLSVDASRPFLITLPPGWSQIATPFAFSVAAGSITSTGTFEGPHYYDGAIEDYRMCCEPVLMPWEGYFVRNPNDEAITLSIPPIEAAATAPTEARAEDLFPETGFMLQLQAQLPEHDLHDTHNYLGFAEQAAASKHGLTLAEPPPIGDHLRLSIVDDGHRYISHFAPQGEDGRQWDLEIEAVLQDEHRVTPKTVRVALIEHGQRPEGYALYVFDRDQQRALAVEGGTFEVMMTSAYPVRRLSVVVGTAAFADEHREGDVPTGFALEGNYPNPFNPETVIRYRLDQPGAVDLAIYNVLGQRVRTLVATEQQSGRYEVVWDGLDDAGRSAASGVYVYQLRAGTFLASRTMLLVR